MPTLCPPPTPRHGSGAGWSGSCGSCGCRRSATSCSAWRGVRAMPGRCRTRSHPWAGRTGGAPPSSPSPSPATPCSQCPVVPCHRGTSGGAEGVHEGRGCPTAVPVSPCPQGPQPDRGGHGTQRLPAAPGRGLPRGAGPELRPRSARPRGHGAGRGRRGRCHVHRGRWERARGAGWGVHVPVGVCTHGGTHLGVLHLPWAPVPCACTRGAVLPLRGHTCPCTPAVRALDAGAVTHV